MNRPFNTRQPNITSSDRIKNLKAKAIYKSAKSSFRHGNKKNANGKIHFTQTGTLRSTRSHELGLLLNRGYALCEDGICPPCVPDCSGQGISGTGVVPRGLFQCAKSPNWSSVTPQTENNLYTHFVSAYLPKMEGNIPFPMGAWPRDLPANSGANLLKEMIWGYDPTGGPGYFHIAGINTENDMDPMGYYKVNTECRRMGDESMTFRRPATGTMIRGEQDINGYYTVCQGGNKANLTWGNNTKHNYLISYDPRNTKVRFNICEKVKNAVGSSATKKWSYKTGSWVRSSPAVSHDGAVVYVGSNDNSLYAINATTGAQLWSFPTGAEVYSSPAVSHDGAVVYVGSNDNSLYAINATDGAFLWSFPTGAGVTSSPAVSHDGAVVYVGSWDKSLYAIDATTGLENWSFPTGDLVFSSPAVSHDGAVVYVGSDDNSLYAINATTGAQLWSFPTGGFVNSSPAVSHDGAVVYVGSVDESLYAINATTGLENWSYATGGFVNSSPAVSHDGSVVYVGSWDYSLYAINATTGAQLWSFPTGGVVYSSPAVSHDGAVIYVGSYDNSVYAINAADGTKKWSYATGAEVDSSPAVSHDGAVIYVGSNDNSLYAINANVSQCYIGTPPDISCNITFDYSGCPC